MGIKQNLTDFKTAQSNYKTGIVTGNVEVIRDSMKKIIENPLVKQTDNIIRGSVIVGGAYYIGDKLADYTGIKDQIKNQLHPAPVATPPVLFNRENATPAPVVPPTNHFSDNAGKYGTALGGVAAAGLGALALRKYLRKKKEK